jgi:hypothetical protein
MYRFISFNNFRILAFLFVFVFSAGFAFSQKGVDSQTKKINEASTKGAQIDSTSSKSYSFGKDKTHPHKRLDNPYRLSARRDVLVNQIVDILKDRKFILDESSSRLSDGIIVTQPLILSKGAVVTRNELGRYGVLTGSDTSWTSARYALRIEVRSLDGIRNEIAVTADVEGKSLDGFTSVWRNVESSGLAEDEFLVRLVETVTGVSPDEKEDN